MAEPTTPVGGGLEANLKTPRHSPRESGAGVGRALTPRFDPPPRVGLAWDQPLQTPRDAPGIEPDCSGLEQAGKEPLPVESAPPSVAITFDVDGSLQTVTATKKPLGCVFSATTPICVKTVRTGSHAEELGVQPGWRLKAISDEDLSNVKLTQALAKMQSAFEPLQRDSNSVELVFDAKGEQQAVIVCRSPLGLNLEDKNGALIVSSVKPGGHGDKLCVQPGWILKSVEGKDVIKPDMLAADKMQVVNNAIKSLPLAES